MNLLGAIAQAGVAGEAARAGGFQISRSLRFNSADSAYLSRTPASAGNRKTWTWSGWVKISAFSTARRLFSARIGLTGDQTFIQTASDNTLLIGGNSGAYELRTTAVYRDASAWYHIVLVFDTTQATSSNRIKLYVNGSQVTALQTATYPSLNLDTFVNATNPHSLGAETGVPGEFFNGYMTEINFIDGQALTPSSFGETNATTGVWSPIAYAGSYGTNGFHLDFSDNSSTTALGYDAAGSNDWTLNNFSVTAGAGNDSLVDTPTPYGDDTGAGGEVRGNYCTANPLDMNPTLVISNGNLNVTETTGAWLNGRCTFGMSSGKWYAESTVTGGLYQVFGIANSLAINTGYEGSGNGLVGNWAYGNDGSKIVNGVYNAGYGASFTTNDVIGMAFDADAGTLTMYKNGVSQGVLVSGLPANTYFPWVAVNGSTVSFNFGQRPFAYTAPSGFKALVTTNLPEPTVVQGDDYFNTVLYTGTGSSLGVTGVGFQPDWVWIKERSGAADHGLYDAVRGTTKQLESNTTDAETTEATGLTAFGSDGFTVGALAQLNTSEDTYVAWNWKANGAGVSNTAGTIASTVSVSTTSGFSIVTFTTSGSHSTATIGHGLGAVPSMIILKNRNGVPNNWNTYHRSLGNTQALYLQSTSAAITSSVFWNDTSPTSTVFTVGNNLYSGTNHVAYCFAEIEGFSKFGSYTGNGSADGPFVYTGFRPAWIMFRVTSGGSWVIFDAKRDAYNLSDKRLLAENSIAEIANGFGGGDFVSNGWKFRGGISNDTNASGATYIYMAFAENPFKNSLAR